MGLPTSNPKKPEPKKMKMKLKLKPTVDTKSKKTSSAKKESSVVPEAENLIRQFSSLGFNCGDQFQPQEDCDSSRIPDLIKYKGFQFEGCGPIGDKIDDFLNWVLGDGNDDDMVGLGENHNLRSFDDGVSDDFMLPLESMPMLEQDQDPQQEEQRRRLRPSSSLLEPPEMEDDLGRLLADSEIIGLVQDHDLQVSENELDDFLGPLETILLQDSDKQQPIRSSDSSASE